MTREKILIVDDDESLRKVLRFILEDAGYVVSTVASGEEALTALGGQRPDLVLADIKMPGMDGIALLKEVKRRDGGIPVVILTAFGTIETAVEAMKIGAVDYLTKPISRDELTITVKKILRMQRLEQENAELRESLKDKFRFDNIIGLSPAMKQVFDIVRKVAVTEASVLITGESGTGKELFAKAIHFNSPRRNARLVAVNCAAIPSELLENELFGHVQGAFTGALKDKEGKFQLADGGTLFLDEIGSLPLPLQAKLLRALQEKEVEKLGDDKAIPVDVRVISATNRSLPELIRRGEFREDLFYRLNVVPMQIPPLRERSSDIPLLVSHFIKKYSGDTKVRMSKSALEALLAYRWPGNVRELENFCERMILMRSSEVIDEGSVRAQIELMVKEQTAFAPAQATLPELERQAILDALSRSNWNQSRAARILGIPRHVLLYRMKKFDIRTAGRRTEG